MRGQMFDLGAKPFYSRPIRKKAWWRAYKSGKLWLLVPYSFKGIDSLYALKYKVFAKILPDMNIREDQAFITWPLDYAPINIKLEMK